jgi:hypothetical protein
MPIYKPENFDIQNGIELITSPNYPCMNNDIMVINNDPNCHTKKWIIAECIEVVNGDHRHAKNQKYPIYIGYNTLGNPIKVAAPCPPFCIGSSFD